MKKIFLFLLIAISIPSLAQKMVIKLAGQSEPTVIPVWQIDTLSFVEFQAGETTVGEPVDLGLKVKWSYLNIGAKDSTDVGYLFGWGNPDFDNHSTNLKFFPSSNIQSNIIGTDMDVAKVYWGASWRMPSVEDFKELLTCTWEWIPEKKSYKITNPEKSEAYLYLPMTGYSFGESEGLNQDSAFYWTGNISGDSAICMKFPSAATEENKISESNLLEAFRANRFAIRPVYGKYVLPISISSELLSQSKNTATVNLNLEGLGTITEFGFLYGTTAGVTYEQSEGDQPLVGRKSFTLEGELNTSLSETIVLDDLDFDQTYYCIAYYKNEEGIVDYTEDEWTFKTEVDDRLVDLGLSVKWARYDLGATGIWQYNDANYAWGATKELNSPHYSSIPADLSYTDYDIAYQTWGDQWRMPTRAEFTELYTKCVAKDTTIVDASGKWISGIIFRRNNPAIKDSLFLPASGGGPSYMYRGQASYYWTSENFSEYRAYQCRFDGAYLGERGLNIYDELKSAKASIRPVYGVNDPSKFIEDPEIDPDQPVKPDEPTEPEDTPEETEEGKEITAVDLGLTSGTLWGSQNIGAKNPNEGGSYFAWEETAPKMDATNPNWGNYTLDSYQYYVDGKFIANLGDISGRVDYDAASKTLGGKWRMPTLDQFTELETECTWEWKSQEDSRYNYVPGYIVKSKKNGNSIFLPAVSYYNGQFRGENGNGFYWTSTFYVGDDSNRFAFAYRFENGSHASEYHLRTDGLTIRPVQNK